MSALKRHGSGGHKWSRKKQRTQPAPAPAASQEKFTIENYVKRGTMIDITTGEQSPHYLVKYKDHAKPEWQSRTWLVSQGCGADLDRQDAEWDAEEALIAESRKAYQDMYDDPMQRNIKLCFEHCDIGRTVKGMAKWCGRQDGQILWDRLPTMEQCANPNCVGHEKGEYFHKPCFDPYLPCCGRQACNAVCYPLNFSLGGKELEYWVKHFASQVGKKVRAAIARTGKAITRVQCGTSPSLFCLPPSCAFHVCAAHTSTFPSSSSCQAGCS